MASVIDICNLALAHIGAQRIDSLEEASSEAQACKMMYPVARDKMVQGPYQWRWSSRRAVMAAVANDRGSEWGFAYQAPANLLRPRKILMHNPNSDVPMGATAVSHAFEYEEGKIYCNLSPAVLSYTMRIVDPQRFPPLFIVALSYQLAVMLAMPVTRDPKVRAGVYELAMIETGMAQTADANEVPETWATPSEIAGLHNV